MKIEDEVFNLIFAMSKCHHPIRISNALQLINDLISNTEYQVKLDLLKGKFCVLTEEDGNAVVGKGYWSGFMKQNGHRLNHVKPHKFGLYRTNWCKYGAFVEMYDSTEKALVGQNA